MDPALQELARPGAGPPDEEVAVILRLQDPGRQPAGVRIVARFGDIVTARINRSSIRRVWSCADTVSVKAPRNYTAEVEPPAPAVDAVADEAEPAPRPPIPFTGDGVVIGFVDWGWDIAHPDLRHPDGSTRLLCLWDQRRQRDGAQAQPYGYGRIIAADDINAALRANDPYRALGYDPADFDSGQGAHGTHTASIAAGLAPDADFVFVNMGRQENPAEVPLGDSCELLEALHFIDVVAGDRPCVINLSLGRHAGEHTGHTCVEMAMDQFLTSRPGRAIVQSCGNYFQRRAHESWQLRPGGVRELFVETDPHDPTPNEIDIWYPGRDRITVEVSSPDRILECRAPPASAATITVGDTTVARLYHRLHDPNNGDNQCSIFLDPTPGVTGWEIRLIGDRIDDGRVHAWIERDGGCRSCQSRFSRGEADPRTTTGSIANGFHPIVVGAYDPHRHDRPLGRFSSSGPTRDGRQKPDLLAPGVMISGALSRGADTGQLYTRMSGTSMAAPTVTGTVALMYEAAGRPLTIEETRRALLASCQAPPDELDPLRAGYGYLDAVRSVRTMTPALALLGVDSGLIETENEAAQMEFDEELAVDSADGEHEDFRAVEQSRGAPPAAETGPLRCPMFAGDHELRDVRAGRLRLAPPGTAPYPAPVRSEGPAIRKVQLALIAAGYRLALGADAMFGPETGRAVAAFKTAHRIGPSDPVVGPQTIAALDAVCADRVPPEPRPQPCRFAVAASGRMCAPPHPAPAPRVPIPMPPPPRPDQKPPRARVAIIGGGFAGLMAAWSLNGGGLAVTVFEARDRLGGRVRSDTSFVPGKIVEAGAELIGENHPTWILLAKTFGLTRTPLTSDDDYHKRGLKTRVCLGGRELTKREKQDIEDELTNKILPAIGREAQPISALQPWNAKDAVTFDKMSVAQAFDRSQLFGPKSTLARQYLEFIIENDNCAPVSQHSYLALLTAVSAGRMGSDMLGYWTHTETHRCAGGNEQLAAHLAKPVRDVRLNTPVAAVTLGPAGARITYRRADGRHQEPFDFVILAGPPGTWPRIHSDPPFDATKFTVAHGPAVKYLSSFADRFWERQSLAPAVKSDRIGSVWEGTDNQDIPTGFALSVYSGSQFVHDDATYANRLEELYPGYLTKRLKHQLVDWTNEPHIMTGYAVPAPMQVTTVVKNLNSSFQGRLFFAGEQTSPGFFGYMEGALQSGLFAAYRVAVAAGRSSSPVKSSAPARRTGTSTPESVPEATAAANVTASSTGQQDLTATPLRADLAAQLFDRIAANVSHGLERQLETVATPSSQLLRPLHVGDLVITRGRGSPFAHIDVVADPQLHSHTSAGHRRDASQPARPGLYVRVVAPPPQRRAGDAVAQVASAGGVVPDYTVILRAVAGESEPVVGPCPDIPVPPSQRPATLQQPAVHAGVRDIQRKLNAFHTYRIDHGQPGLPRAPLKPDCIFGKRTRAAVTAFQQLVFPGQTDLHTGIVGPKTWAQLDALSIGADGVAQVVVAWCRFAGPSGPLTWDAIIGLDLPEVDIELAAAGLPIPTMPSTVTVMITAHPPNRVTVIGAPPGMAVTLTRAGTDPGRVVYRAKKIIGDFRTILGVPGGAGVATVVRAGGTSDTVFRDNLGAPARGAATQPTSPGARTSDETAHVPDAWGLFRSGGVQVLQLAPLPTPHWQLPAPVCRQARSPAQFFYYSGHGLTGGKLAIDTQPQACPQHGPVSAWLGPDDLLATWKPADAPHVLILAGCSVLAVELSGRLARRKGPGIAWAQLLATQQGSVTTLLGYAGKAPCDHSHSHALGDTIATEIARRIAAGSTDLVHDWLVLNGDCNVTNAAAIDARGYWWLYNKRLGGYEIRGPEPLTITPQPTESDNDADQHHQVCSCAGHRADAHAPRGAAPSPTPQPTAPAADRVGHPHRGDDPELSAVGADDHPTDGVDAGEPVAEAPGGSVSDDFSESLRTEAEFDAKAALMRATGFDPGAPIGPVESAGSGEFRRYQHALLTVHPAAGMHEVHGLIMQRYLRMNGPWGYLGYPVTDETAAGIGRFNRFQFQGSAITWHPVVGVHEMHGRIGEVYWAQGGATGTWGYPVTDEYPDGSTGKSSDFEGGTLAWTPANDVLEVPATVPGTVVPAAGDWPAVNQAARMRYAVDQLVVRYELPVNGAAGVVGNLYAESAVIPSRIEGSRAAHPMRAQNFSGVTTDFTAEQIMIRPHPTGPRLPGVGLAQWTSRPRRAGMFTHVYNGRAYGAETLRSMDAQLDYLVSELRSSFRGVFSTITAAGVSVEAASDEMVYNFEIPASVLLNRTQKRPRSDPAVQQVFRERRAYSRQARNAYAPTSSTQEEFAVVDVVDSSAQTSASAPDPMFGVEDQRLAQPAGDVASTPAEMDSSGFADPGAHDDSQSPEALSKREPTLVVSPFPIPATLPLQMFDSGLISCEDAASKPAAVTELCGAVLDLTGDPAMPSLAAHNPVDMLYVGSLSKIYVMYVAFELKQRAERRAKAMIAAGLSTSSPGWQAEVFAQLKKEWQPHLNAAFPGLPRGFPKLSEVVALSSTGDATFTENTPPLTDAELDAIGEFGAPRGKFRDWMRLMMRWSNNAAASKCILALSYPYLNGVLGSAGFFDKTTKNGLWISGDYLGHDWLPKNGAGQKLTDRWAKLQNRQTTNFAGTAFQVARLVTLLAQGKLVNPAASSEMLAITTGADGIGSYIQASLAAAPRGFLRVFSKIGFGNDSVSHDCAFVRVNDGGGDPTKAVKYVAVILGSPPAKGRSDLRQLTVAYHDCILSRHP